MSSSFPLRRALSMLGRKLAANATHVQICRPTDAATRPTTTAIQHGALHTFCYVASSTEWSPSSAAVTVSLARPLVSFSSSDAKRCTTIADYSTKTTQLQHNVNVRTHVYATTQRTRLSCQKVRHLWRAVRLAWLPCTTASDQRTLVSPIIRDVEACGASLRAMRCVSSGTHHSLGIVSSSTT